MHKQTNGVATELLLATAIANIFIGYYEEKLFSETRNPPIYFRHVSDPFVSFDFEAKADELCTN